MTGDEALRRIEAAAKENEDLHHRLRQELDRNRDLQARVNELEMRVWKLSRTVRWLNEEGRT